MAYSLWHQAGKQAAILSGRRSAAVERRAAELKIAHVLQGHEQKAAPLQTLIEELGLSPRQVCFVGDDLADLPVLRAVGLAACPADAASEVKDAAHLIARAAGGRGAVREVVEVILKSQGRWDRFGGPNHCWLLVNSYRVRADFSRAQEDPQSRGDVDPPRGVLLRVRRRLRRRGRSVQSDPPPRHSDVRGHDSNSKREAIAYARPRSGRITGAPPRTWPTATTTPSAGYWIYAQEWKKIEEEDGVRYDGKRMRLKPFAMIIKSSDGKNTKMITSDRAVFDLSEPLGFNVNSDGEPLKIKHAHLEPNVEIRDDKGTPDDPSDDMRIGPLTTLDYDEPSSRSQPTPMSSSRIRTWWQPVTAC